MEKSTIKTAARIILGANLIFAGISHLSVARKAFRAQVPDWVPLKKGDTVVYSGIAEIALGSALVFTPEKHREAVARSPPYFSPRYSLEISLNTPITAAPLV
jgi:uncharacterized membrane protein